MDKPNNNICRAGGISSAVEGDSGRTFTVDWLVNPSVRRVDFWTDQEFIETLDTSDGAIDMSRLNSGNSPFLLDHYNTIGRVIGVVEKAWIDRSGDSPVGKAEIRLSNRPEVDGIWRDIKDGILNQVSLGATKDKVELDKKQNPWVQHVRRWTPMEISLVAIGADADATINRAQQRAEFEPRGDKMEEEQKEVEAEVTRSAPQVDAQALVARAMQEANELAQFTLQQCVRHGCVDLAPTLVGRSREQVQGAILEHIASRQAPPVTPSRVESGGHDEQTVQRAAMIDGLAARLSHRTLGTDASEEARAWSHRSLMDLARECAGGRATRYMSDDEVLQRAMSGGDFPNIIGTNIEREVLRQFNEAPTTWREFTRDTQVADFRDYQFMRLGLTSMPEEIGSNGELKYQGFDDASTQNGRLKTWGRGVRVGRRLLINDDIGAIETMIGDAMGAMNARQAYEAWNAVLSNPTMDDGTAFFHANRKNLAASGAALSQTTLSTAREAFRSRKDKNNQRYVGIMPNRLVIPYQLEATANKILTLPFMPTTGTDAVERVWGTMLTPVIEPLVSDVSATGWYLVATAAQGTTPIRRLVLRGQSTPVIRREIEFDTLDMKHAIVFDFAFAPGDPEAWYKNAGA